MGSLGLFEEALAVFGEKKALVLQCLGGLGEAL
jgi:hypothetical protein